MNLTNSIIYYGEAVLGNSKFFNGAVRFFYLKILVPTITYFLKKNHPQLKKILIRNSLYEMHFNAFYSDIDTVLVVENDSNLDRLINDFLSFKRFFKMLDIPEIYNEKEYQQLENIKTKPEWNLINFCWHIRKINWCYRSLDQNSDKLNRAKMNRAIKASFEKILKEDISYQQISYSLKNFKKIDNIFALDSNQPRVCYLSRFMATVDSPKVILNLSLPDYIFFNSLMPGESIDETILNKVTPLYLENKSALLLHELFLSRSALRIKKAQRIDHTEHIQWCSTLEENLKMVDEFNRASVLGNI